MNKKILTIFLAILLICTLCVTIVACGDKDNNDDSNPNGEQTDTPSTDTPAPDDGGSSPIVPSPDDGGSSPIEPNEPGNEEISSKLLFNLKTDDTYEVVGYTGDPISVVIPSTYNGKAVTSIGRYAFENCTSLSSVTIPDSVTSIGDDAFWACDSLSSVNYLGTIEQWCGITFGDYSANPLYYAKKLYLNGELLEEDIVIPNTVTEIKAYAFEGCTSIKSVTIPDSVTSIGSYAFHGCNSLTSVTIGNSVTSIGNGAFWDCDSLTSVTIPNSVTSIGDDAFAYCDSLTSLTIGNSVTGIGSGAFDDCTSLSSVNYLGTIEQWCGITFGRFNANPLSNGAKLYLNGELVEEDLVIPNTVTEIKDYAFWDCDSLTSVTIPDSVTSIGYGAFYDCYSLISVTIPDSVTSIGDEAFVDCDSLISVTIGNSVTRIGWSAFSNCDSLSSVTIGNSVTSIGEYAFYDCDSLSTVYYNGTKEEWSGISIGRYNGNLTGATRYYYSETEPTTSGNYWHYVEGVPTPW